MSLINNHIQKDKKNPKEKHWPHLCRHSHSHHTHTTRVSICFQASLPMCKTNELPASLYLNHTLPLSHPASLSLSLSLSISLFLSKAPSLPHASWFFSGDSSRVMAVNSSVLPFSWIFSLFMSVTISCSRSWARELATEAAAPFPSLLLFEVIIRV